MNRRYAGRERTDCKLSITPMIDVVFLLLIFLILIVQAPEVLGHLDVFRPKAIKDGGHAPKVLQIDVDADGYRVYGCRYELAELEQRLARVTRGVSGYPVVIHCSEDALHTRLIGLLDRCARLTLTNISLLSR